MKTRSDSKPAPRKNTEKKVRRKTPAGKPAPALSMEDLAHELHTHQIELEMQNEELRRAQQEIEESRQKYVELFETAPVGYFVLDRRGLVLENNRTADFLLKRKRTSQILGLPLSRYIRPHSRDIFYKHLNDVLSKEARQNCELEMLRGDGTGFFARLESIAETGHGPMRILTALSDVTEQKAAKTALERQSKKLSEYLEERTLSLLRESHQKKELEVATRNLSASLKEKEVLLRELYHRTKNNMNVISSLIGLQMHQVTDPFCLQLLKDTQNRIQSIALVHKRLYRSESLSEVNMKSYIPELARAIIEGYTENKKPGLHLNIGPVEMNIEKAVPIGLTLNELLSNSLKYAFNKTRKGSINISMNRAKEHVELSYEDSGPGLPKGIDISKTGSLGLKLVYNLATQQLKGNVKNQGAKFIMRFPA